MKSVHLLTVLLFLLLTFQFACHSHNDSAAETVVRKYFLEKDFPDKLNYLTGEYLNLYADAAHFGADLPPGVSGSVYSIYQDSTSSVYAVTMVDSTHSEDLYCYLKKEDGKWKIDAMRGLALPGFYWTMVDSYRGKEDSLSGFELATYYNMELTTRSDSALCQYLVENESRFRELVEKMSGLPDGLMLGAAYRQDEQAQYDTVGIVDSIKALHLNVAGKSPRFEGVYDFNIGGIMDNSVGYFYSADPTRLPEISKNKYILIRHIKGNWYLYKTT